METEPTILHMNQMLRKLSEGPFRAAYMVIEELYILETAKGGNGNGWRSEKEDSESTLPHEAGGLGKSVLVFDIRKSGVKGGDPNVSNRSQGGVDEQENEQSFDNPHKLRIFQEWVCYTT